MKSIRKRTRAREIAIQALYQYDALRRIAGESGVQPVAGPGGFPTEGLAPAWAEMEKFIAAETQDREIGDFARELVSGTLESLEEIDAQLASVVENWRVERIAAMDRAILRLAAFEINARPDVPPKVSINEAIDLAKKYSTGQSGSFVNGVLDKLLQIRREAQPE